MKRRQVVRGLAAAAFAGPGWLKAAFAGEVCKPPALRELELGTLSAAFRSASAARKPLLIFVVPKEVDQRYELGRAFGEWLNHGADEDLAPLADVGLVAVGMDAVRALIPHAGPGEPLLLWVDTQRVPARVERLSGPLPSTEQSGREGREELEAAIDQHIRIFGQWARQRAGGPGSDAWALAARVRQQVVNGKISGTHWAHAGGCADTVELEGTRKPFEIAKRDGGSVARVDEQFMVLCGMGFTPERSRRFLLLFPVVQEKGVGR